MTGGVGGLATRTLVHMDGFSGVLASVVNVRNGFLLHVNSTKVPRGRLRITADDNGIASRDLIVPAGR